MVALMQHFFIYWPFAPDGFALRRASRIARPFSTSFSLSKEA